MNLASVGESGVQEAKSRLAFTLELVREISLQTDPQQMIQEFRQRFAQMVPRDRTLSLSRRGLRRPWYHITRCSDWREDINPWTQKDRLPLLSGGLLSDLLYRGEPLTIEDLVAGADDPAAAYLTDMRSLIALPLYDQGEGINMVVMLSRESGSPDAGRLADMLLQANLFGRATHNLVLARELHAAHAALDAEIRRVADLQRALLPAAHPDIPRVGIATHYAAAARAGGDYFDFFDLGEDRWGLLIGDVSGHGPSAAMGMAVTRTLLHAVCRKDQDPPSVLAYLNEHLSAQAAQYPNSFVTLFYGELDARARKLRYASAGHPPPIVMRRDGEVRELDAAQGFPLGVFADARFEDSLEGFEAGDSLLMYTDGVTEAMNPQGHMYGRDRLLACLSDPTFSAQGVVDCITSRLEGWTQGRAAADDCTLVTLRMK